ncbi:early nodulin-like protein 18 [Tasmannia lanceolata]|uniref:early nodulin-like protein 18 n=1 Tax=Tasmannia lanceolata TaxID=3420 RepID=UPI004064C7FE
MECWQNLSSSLLHQSLSTTTKVQEEMEQSSYRNLLFSFQFCLLFLSFSRSLAYTNYTVGDSLGWFDSLLKPTINYHKWASGKNFSLGDFLIFNTDKNHSVIQTYNHTTYKLCDYNDAEEDDTLQWSESDPTISADAVSVSVPLLKEGSTYFFSGDYDGEQCKFGQHFAINVTHGEGLPGSLQSQSMDSPAPASPDDDNSVPDTQIPTNFSSPVEGDSVQQTSRSVSLAMFGKWKEFVVFLGLVWVWGDLNFFGSFY